ncbi:MAG: DUF4880 domain-containing protein [Parvularculaceae bacterium]
MNDEPEVVAFRPDANEKPQAADWLAKLDRGELAAEERAAFERWLAEDPQNREAIRAAAAFWYGLNAPLSKLREELPVHRRTAARRAPSAGPLLAQLGAEPSEFRRRLQW